MSKTINNIPVSDEVFGKVALLQERLRRIDAEAKLLMLEKADAEREVKEIMAEIDPPKAAVDSPLAQQVAAVTTPAVA